MAWDENYCPDEPPGLAVMEWLTGAVERRCGVCAAFVVLVTLLPLLLVSASMFLIFLVVLTLAEVCCRAGVSTLTALPESIIAAARHLVRLTSVTGNHTR